MKIYRVKEDVNNYQAVVLKDDSLWGSDIFNFDAKPKGNIWNAPDVFVLEPNLLKGDFLYFTPGVLVAELNINEQVFGFLQSPSCELLPLRGKTEMYNLVNVVECIDILDEKRTKWEYGKMTGSPVRIKEYYFHAEHLTESPLFKIPQTCRVEIFTCEGLKDPEDEFKYTIESNNIKGLIFEEVWNNSKY